MFLCFSARQASTRRLRNLSGLGMVAALVLGSTLAYGQAKGLTLEEALALSTQRSASNQAAASSIQASREMVAKAGQLPDPMFRAGIENLPINGPDRFSLSRDFMTMRRVGIEQQWVTADKRNARTERAQLAVEAEEANYLANVAKVREETAMAWLNLLYAQRSLSLVKQLESETSQDVQTSQSAFRGAKVGGADVTQAQVNLAKAQDLVRKGEQAVKSARIILARWTAAPVESVSDTLPPLTSHVPGLPVEELERYHPMLLTAKRAWTLADAETVVATRERRPDWTVEAAYSQRGSAYSNMVSFGVSIPLPINASERQDRDIAEKSALATKARLQYEDALRDLQAEIADQSAMLASLNERVSQLKAQLLPAASQQAELATAAYRGGTGSLASVFNARRMALEAQLQILDVEKEAALTWAKLEFHVIPHSQTSVGRAAP
jgi:outer membrane protein TolC